MSVNLNTPSHPVPPHEGNPHPTTEIPIDNLNESPPVERKSLYLRILDKIFKVVKVVFITISAIGLFIINPAFFVTGFITAFVASIIFPQNIEKVLERVSLIWKKYCAAIVIAYGFGLLIGWPVILAGSSFLIGSFISAKLVSVVCKEK